MDISDRDDYWLLDPTRGHLALEEAIVTALHVWVPTDTQGNWLSQSPILWIPSEQVHRDEATPDSQDWGESTMHFSLQYQLYTPDNTF
jgi:hypothetical protein